MCRALLVGAFAVALMFGAAPAAQAGDARIIGEERIGPRVSEAVARCACPPCGRWRADTRQRWIAVRV
jgi:hypothetical protein